MQIRTRKLISLLIGITLVLTLLPTRGALTVSAAGGEQVLSEIDPRVLASALDIMEDDFNRPTVDWNITGGEAEAVDTLSEAPYSVYEGTRSLQITAEGGTVSLSKKPTSLSSAAHCQRIAVALWVPSSAGEVTATLSLRTAKTSYTSSAAVEANRWQVVLFDLTDSGLSGSITSLTLTLSTSDSRVLRCLLDCVGALTSTESLLSLRYLSAYSAEGCSLSHEENLCVALSGSGQYIEALSPILTDYSGGAGIRVRLINTSSCRSLTLYYTTLGSSEYTEARSITVTIPEDEGVVSCLFAIPNAYIGSFRLAFDGSPSGQIEILSVSAAPCYTSAASIGTVSDCRIARDKRSITVKGSLSSEEASRYADCTLYLYELALWEEPSVISLSRPTVAQTTLNGGEFTFSLPLSQAFDELYKKYAVMVYCEGQLIPVGSPRIINNPEILASFRSSGSASSIKGFWPATGNYLFDGLSHTVLEIRIDRLITLSPQDSLRYVAGDLACYLNASYLAELDAAMLEYKEQGIAVRFLLRLERPDDLSLASLLCHPLSDGGSYVAFNTATEEGIDTLRIVCDFLVRRYGTPSGITDQLSAVVVGSSVNHAYENYNLGKASLLSFTKAYTSALRTVYNAVRSVSESVEVYLPLGGDWYTGVLPKQTGAFDARSTLEAVAACLREEGDIAWQLSYDIFPGEGIYAYEQIPDLSAEAARITAANLEVLLSFLSRESLMNNGVLRSVMLLETEPKVSLDENDRIRRSADYVYTRLRLAARGMKQITAYLPAHPVDYMDTLAKIDSNRFTEIAGYAAELIGAERFAALTAAAGTLSDHYLSENEAVSVIPSAVKGEVSVFDFSKDLDGWQKSLFCASAQGGVSVDEDNRLRVRFHSADPLQWRGIAVHLDTPLDLSEAPYLGFRVRAAVLPEGVDEIELTVVVYAGSSLHRSTIRISADTDTLVVADLTGFEARSVCDGMGIYVRSADGSDIGEPTLLISAIRAMSEHYSAADLDDIIRRPDIASDTQKTVSLYTVLGIGALALLALGTEVVRILRRRQFTEENE